MIGLGKMWKSVRGDDRGAAQAEEARPSTIPRAIPAPRAPLPPQVIEAAPPSETRGAERFVPTRTGTVLTTVSGKRIAARIINISQTGVALEAELSEFGAGDIALVGTRPVLPGRRITLGIVFMFRKPLDPKHCGPDIVL
ncbi:hypothetical protein [Lichenibacterium ramalinae]|uniref:PilZ domain-containing protein n=1 Tax=Lichenibacterium ramalinae TaxID=2316527 RepID=A0A4Q2RIQ1_9HYPH|nr:hypothetical protein [Lichenibacterium ramalinae]RYB06116.1 hypothetical protein D3272_07995 [Lichenibacterium ramalinae]